MGWRSDDEGYARFRRGAAWSDGYTVDTHYAGPMVVDLSPPRLSLVAALEGQPPLPGGRTLTWVDLGCGHGLSAAMVAAANPDVEVWGFDYNPAHIERARALAGAAGLENCHFAEAGFDVLAADRQIGPAEVDVFVINGVYSWIAPVQQAAAVSVIGDRLVPGGLAYVMYESPTGWAAMIPVAEALHLHAAFDGRPGEVAFHDAAASVVRLAESGAAAFPLGPREQTQLESWATLDGGLGAHEYLGAHFGPLMFDQVADSMTGAKCDFIGSLDPVDHVRRFWAPPDLADLVGSINDVVTRELLRDLINQQALRRDVFRRGLASALPGDARRWLDEIRVTWLGKPLGDEPVRAASGRIGLNRELYEPLIDAMGRGDLGIETILSINTGWGFDDAVTAIVMLVSGGYVAPVATGGVTDVSFAASRRLNEALIAENRSGANHATLVAPAIGAAIEVDSIEMAALGAVWAGADPDVDGVATLVFDELAASGRLVREEGELVRDAEEARRIVAGRVATALAKNAGVFVSLGISDGSPR